MRSLVNLCSYEVLNVVVEVVKVIFNFIIVDFG